MTGFLYRAVDHRSLLHNEPLLWLGVEVDEIVIQMLLAKECYIERHLSRAFHQRYVVEDSVCVYRAEVLEVGDIEQIEQCRPRELPVGSAQPQQKLMHHSHCHRDSPKWWACWLFTTRVYYYRARWGLLIKEQDELLSTPNDNKVFFPLRKLSTAHKG